MFTFNHPTRGGDHTSSIKPFYMLSMRLKLVLPLLIMVGAFALLTQLYWLPHLLDQQRLDNLHYHETRLGSLAEVLIPHLAVNDYQALDKTLNARMHIEEWHTLVLLDASGSTIQRLDNGIKGDESVQLIHITRKLHLDGKYLGQLELNLDPDARHRQENRLIQTLDLLLVSLLIITLIISAPLLDRLIRRPILAIATAAQRVSNGDFDVVLPDAGNDELGGLVHAIGSIRNDLQGYRDRLVDEAQVLQHQQDLLQLILDSTGEGIIGMDSEGICTFTNHAALKMLGYAEQDSIVGESMCQLLHVDALTEDAICRLGCDVCESFRVGQYVNEQETCFRRQDGLPFPATYRTYPISRDQRVVGAVLTFFDITEQRLSAQDLLENRRALQLKDNAIASSINAVVFTGLDGRISYVNPAFLDMWGYESDEQVRGSLLSEYWQEEDGTRILKKITTWGQWFGDLTAQRKDGSTYAIQMSAHVVYDQMGKPDALMAFMVDVSDYKQAQEQLSQSAVVFQNTNEGVIITDIDNRIIAVNLAFSKITGYQESEVLGKPPNLLKSNEHGKSFYVAMWETIHRQGQWQGEIQNRRKNGEIYPVWLNISTVYDAHGQARNYVAVFSDMTYIKRSEEQLDRLAHYDTLTGLPNRLLFNSRIEHAIARARRDKHQSAILLLDLDHFKHINDSLGHPVGDHVLQLFTKRMQARLREEDTLARVDGDEFGILLEIIPDDQDAAIVARKMMQSLTDPFIIDGHELFLNTSIGISIFPEDGNEVASLIKNADAALYRAKDQGRNAYQFYKEEMSQRASERVQIEAELRRALENDDLVMYYQPQVLMSSKELISAEALIRWQHPQRGLILPDRFIPIAEESGLILEMGKWVLQQSCRQIQQWREAGYSIQRIAVNLSDLQIRRGDIVETVKQVLHETRLGPRHLELEVTENFIMHDREESINVLHSLRALGVELAIDDFGTGYSGLSYLKHLPVHRLKIDQSFIKDVGHDSNDQAIARAIIGLGKSLDMKVIAEGIETTEHELFLVQEQCDEGQGYLYGHALPATEFEQLMCLRTPV